MKKKNGKMIKVMRNLIVVLGLAGGLAAGQIVYAADGGYAAAENVIDISPADAGATTEVTGYTLINDRLGQNGQKNYYTFTAPVDGEYRFYFEPYFTDNAGTNPYLYEITDEYDGIVAVPGSFSTLATRASEAVVLLDEGINYTIMVGQYNNGYGKYSVEIDYPLSAQQFLDDFSAGITAGEDDGSEVEESAGEETELSDVPVSESLNEDLILQQLEEIQSRLDALESEINEVKDENEALKNVLDENEIEYD